MNQTKLMSKLFSDSTPTEFKEKIAEKIEEAKKNGSSELVEGDESLQFADLGDSVIVEDQANGNEVTRISDNPEKEDDLVMEAVDMSEAPLTEEEKEQYNEGFKAGEQFEEGKQDQLEKSEGFSEKTYAIFKDKKTGRVGVYLDNPMNYDADTKIVKDEFKSREEAEKYLKDHEEEIKKYSDDSKTLPDAKVELQEGADGTHITGTIPEIEVKIEQGITDAEKAGVKNYSLRLKNFSDPAMAARMASAIRKAFSSEEELAKEACDGAQVDKSIDDALRTETKSDADATDGKAEDAKAAEEEKEAKDKTDESMGEEAHDTAEAAEGKTEEFADKTEQDKADESAGEDKSVDDKELKEIADKANELAQKVEELKETRDKETAEEVKDMSEKLLERAETYAAKGHDMTEVKEKCTQFSGISNEILDKIQQGVGKDAEVKVDENEVKVTDADGTKETKVEADAEDATPTVTVEGVEPTPMKVLLTPAGADPDELDITPKVNPNDASTTGKVFSQVEKVESSNPFLTCEF